MPRCVASTVPCACCTSKFRVHGTSRLHDFMAPCSLGSPGSVDILDMLNLLDMLRQCSWTLYFYLFNSLLSLFLFISCIVSSLSSSLAKRMFSVGDGKNPGIKAWRTGCEYTSLLRCICCMLVWDRLGTCASCGINSASTNCHRLSIARKHVPARGKRKSILFLWGADRERERETFLACFREKCCR